MISERQNPFTMMKEEQILKQVMNEKGIEKGDINIIIGDDFAGFGHERLFRYYCKLYQNGFLSER